MPENCPIPPGFGTVFLSRGAAPKPLAAYSLLILTMRRCYIRSVRGVTPRRLCKIVAIRESRMRRRASAVLKLPDKVRALLKKTGNARECKACRCACPARL
jgi:hypothetical protein